MLKYQRSERVCTYYVMMVMTIGTYGVVYKVYEKIDKDRFYAMKVFKQPIGKEGVNQAIYREVGVREDDDDDDCNVQLLKELNHENVLSWRVCNVVLHVYHVRMHCWIQKRNSWLLCLTMRTLTSNTSF